MKHAGWLLLALGAWVAARPLHGQTTLDALERELAEVRQLRQDAVQKNTSAMLDQLATAMASPEAALALLNQAGAKMPDKAPVRSRYEHETPDEKARREAQDVASSADYGLIAQLHCGLMRFGALFILQPDAKTLPADWLAWEKSAAVIYGKLSSNPPLKGLELKRSPLNDYFGFSWNGKEQGTWKVSDLPGKFRTDVLDAERTAHDKQLLTDWDVYIAMRSADQPKQDVWTQVDLPVLQFDKACDDYTLAPSTEKLAAAIAVIKANPGHPQVDDMLGRATRMMQDWRGQKSGQPAASTPTPTSAPTPASG